MSLTLGARKRHDTVAKGFKYLLWEKASCTERHLLLSICICFSFFYHPLPATRYPRFPQCRLEEGDAVMADKGFLVRDLLAFEKIQLVSPAYCRGPRLSSKAVTHTRRVAALRFHVERSILKLKHFRILSGVIPLLLKPMLDLIVFVFIVKPLNTYNTFKTIVVAKEPVLFKCIYNLY